MIAAKNRILSFALALSLVLGMMVALPPVTAYGAYNDEYDIENDGPVTINASGDYRIYGTGSQTQNTITVTAGVNARITLEDVKIATPISSGMAFAISSGAAVYLTLEGENRLESGNNQAGLGVPSGATLEITADSTGGLQATGGTFGAGIGGGNHGAGGSVTISGGTVTAKGGTFSAGIGGGNDGDGGVVTIAGGTVTATGTSGGAGIGGGDEGDGGVVTIAGGTVTATGTSGGAGIGGGDGGGRGSLEITGGSVFRSGAASREAQATYDGTNPAYRATLTIGDPAVAGGSAVTGGDISTASYYGYNDVYTDSQGMVYFWLPEDTNTDIDLTVGGSVYSGRGIDIQTNNNNPAILRLLFEVAGAFQVENTLTYGYAGTVLTVTGGSGRISMAENVTQTNTDTIVVSGDAAITLDGVDIDVSTSGNTGAFAISSGAAVELTLVGDNVLKSGGSQAGLGVPSGASLEITAASTGRLEARGGNLGAGIGGGNGGNGGSVSISGGTVIATGGYGGAGIGGGNGGNGGSVSISGGTVTASRDGGNGGDIGAGGNTLGNNNGTLAITGGSVLRSGTNSREAQATNGSGNVYRATLTVGDPKVADSAVTAGSISTASSYGIKDVFTDGSGKVYFWLPANTSTDISLTVHGNTFSGSGIDVKNDNSTEATLKLPGTGDFLVENTLTHSYASNVLTVTGGSGRIAMAEGVTQTNTDTIVVSGSAAITLDGVDIDVSGNYYEGAFAISSGARAELTLAGDNALKSGHSRAGLGVPSSASLEITAASTGSLEAMGGNLGAGIGGGDSAAGGSVEIAGGTVSATGGNYGAGIGGGDEGDGGTVIIAGGTVIATSGIWAAGIGGGSEGNGGSVSISGGTVIATGIDDGAGIGGSSWGSKGTLQITGGSVYRSGYADNEAQATNGSVEVYRATLTVGDPKVADSAVTAGDISTAGYYGYKDVYTDSQGMVYFWLPESTNTDIDLTVGGDVYGKDGIHVESGDGTRETLLLRSRVTEVTVTPATATVEKGKTQQFTGTVSGTNNPSLSLGWSVSGGTDSTIDQNGLLSVGEKETADTLTIRATAEQDESKYGEAMVTVADPGEPGPGPGPGPEPGEAVPPKVSPTELELDLKDKPSGSVTLSLGFSGDGVTPLANHATAQSDDPDIAAVPEGHLTGEVTITAKGEGRATITFTFDDPAGTVVTVAVKVADSSGESPGPGPGPGPDPGPGPGPGGSYSSDRNSSSGGTSRNWVAGAKTQLPADAFSWDGIRTLTIDDDGISPLGLQRVLWDGTETDAYSVYQGSVIIRFDHEFIDSQLPGAHTVRVEFLNHTGEVALAVGDSSLTGDMWGDDTHNPDTGGYPDGGIGTTDNPETGDSRSIWAAWLLGCVAAGMLVLNKRASIR